MSEGKSDYKTFTDALAKGRELVSRLETPNREIASYAPLGDLYRFDNTEVLEAQLTKLTRVLNAVLRTYNVDTNRLHDICIISKNSSKKHPYFMRTVVDAKSGYLELGKVRRENDQVQFDRQLPISQLLWNAWLFDASEQQMSVAGLRTIWVKHIEHEATRAVV